MQVVITLVRLTAIWAGGDSDGTVRVILLPVRPNELLPGHDQPVLHVAAGEEELLRLRRSPGYGPGLAVDIRVSVLICAPEMVTVRSSPRCVYPPLHEIISSRVPRRSLGNVANSLPAGTSWWEKPGGLKVMLVVTGYLHRCRLNLRNSCENCSYFCLPRNRFVFLRQRKIPSNQEYSRTEWHRTSSTSVSLGWMIMRFILPQNCMERQTMSSTGITSEPEEYSASVYLRELQSFSLNKF